MQNLKSLYIAVKEKRTQSAINEYTEALQGLLERNNPMEYVSNLEYIIKNSIGLESFIGFINEHGLPIMMYESIIESLNESIRKCGIYKTDDTMFVETLDAINAYVEYHSKTFAMYETCEREDMDDSYLEAYYTKFPMFKEHSIEKLNIEKLQESYGNAIIADIILYHEQFGRLDECFNKLSEYAGTDSYHTWLYEMSQDFSFKDIPRPRFKWPFKKPKLPKLKLPWKRDGLDASDDTSDMDPSVIDSTDAEQLQESYANITMLEDTYNSPTTEITQVSKKIKLYFSTDYLQRLGGNEKAIGAGIKRFQKELKNDIKSTWGHIVIDYNKDVSFSKKMSRNPSCHVAIDSAMGGIFGMTHIVKRAYSRLMSTPKDQPFPGIWIVVSFSRYDANSTYPGTINIKTTRDYTDYFDFCMNVLNEAIKPYISNNILYTSLDSTSSQPALQAVDGSNADHAKVANMENIQSQDNDDHILEPNTVGHLESKSLSGKVASILESKQSYIRESMMLGQSPDVIYTESEIEDIKNLIAFKEYMILCESAFDGMNKLQSEVYDLYSELSGLVEDDESTTMTEAATRTKKTGEMPAWLSRNHNSGYGEDKGLVEDKPESDELNMDDFRRDVDDIGSADDNIPSYDYDAAEASEDADDDEPKSSGDNSSGGTSGNGSNTNYYYYTYTNSNNTNSNSHNQHQADSHNHGTINNNNTNSHNDNSSNKRTGSHNYSQYKDSLDSDETSDLKKESTKLNPFNNIFNESADDDIGDPDDMKPQSDHPIKDILTDIDRKSVKYQQKAKKGVQNAQNAGRAFMKPAKRTTAWISKIVNEWKDLDETKFREKIADPKERSVLRKALSFSIKSGSLLKAGLLLNPFILGVTVLRKVDGDRRYFKARNDMIGELKAELEVIDEKIKDADIKGDNAAKYRLMRFKHEYQKKLAKVGAANTRRKARKLDGPAKLL